MPRLDARASETDDSMVNCLAKLVFGDCGKAETIRMLAREKFYESFGDVNPHAIEDGRVSEETAVKLLRGEVSPEDLPDDVRLDEFPLSDMPEFSADGGVKPQPTTYTGVPDRTQLAVDGTQLSWDQIKQSVADPEDGGHWDDQLTIHPGRISADKLGQRRKPVVRTIVAMLRHEAYDGVLPGVVVDNYIQEYAMQFTDRGEEDGGPQYIRRQYLPKIEKHLWKNPSPNANSYFVTEERYNEAVKEQLSDAITKLETPADVFNRSRWARVNGIENVRGDAVKDWKDDIATHLEEVVIIKQLWGSERDRFENLGDELTDEAIATLGGDPDDVEGVFREYVNGNLTRLSKLQQKHQRDILNHHASEAVVEFVENT